MDPKQRKPFLLSIKDRQQVRVYVTPAGKKYTFVPVLIIEFFPKLINVSLQGR